MQWPFPYHKPSSVREQPLHKLVRSALMERYLPFIDALACSGDEWVTRQGEFIAADGSNHVPVPKQTDSRDNRKSAAALQPV
jgi:hypothetical protein